MYFVSGEVTDGAGVCCVLQPEKSEIIQWWLKEVGGLLVERHLTLYQFAPQTLCFCSNGCAGNEADLLQHNGCRTEKKNE